MQIHITIVGSYTDGQAFSSSHDTIEKAIAELEMVEVNEDAFDHMATIADSNGDLIPNPNYKTL